MGSGRAQPDRRGFGGRPLAWRRWKEKLAGRHDRLPNRWMARWPLADPLLRLRHLLIGAPAAALGRCPGLGRVLAMRRTGWISMGPGWRQETARPRLLPQGRPPRRRALARCWGWTPILAVLEQAAQRRSGRGGPLAGSATGDCPISGRQAQPGLICLQSPPLRRAARAAL